MNHLERTIHSHMNCCMPLKTVSVSSRGPFWVTPLVKYLQRAKSRISPFNREKLNDINRRISEGIRQNRTNFNVLKGSKAWGKRFDTLSQRRSRPANFCLDNELLTTLNDYFGTLCHDDTYVKPSLMSISSSFRCGRR